MSNEFYRTSSYVAEKFSISIKTLDRWVKDKKIIPVYLGEERRFTDSEIDRFEKENIKAEISPSTIERMEKIRGKKNIHFDVVIGDVGAVPSDSKENFIKALNELEPNYLTIIDNSVENDNE